MPPRPRKPSRKAEAAQYTPEQIQHVLAIAPNKIGINLENHLKQYYKHEASIKKWQAKLDDPKLKAKERAKALAELETAEEKLAEKLVDIMHIAPKAKDKVVTLPGSFPFAPPTTIENKSVARVQKQKTVEGELAEAEELQSELERMLDAVDEQQSHLDILLHEIKREFPETDWDIEPREAPDYEEFKRNEGAFLAHLGRMEQQHEEEQKREEDDKYFDAILQSGMDLSNLPPRPASSSSSNAFPERLSNPENQKAVLERRAKSQKDKAERQELNQLKRKAELAFAKSVLKKARLGQNAAERSEMKAREASREDIRAAMASRPTSTLDLGPPTDYSQPPSWRGELLLGPPSNYSQPPSLRDYFFSNYDDLPPFHDPRWSL